MRIYQTQVGEWERYGWGSETEDREIQYRYNNVKTGQQVVKDESTFVTRKEQNQCKNVKCVTAQLTRSLKYFCSAVTNSEDS